MRILLASFLVVAAQFTFGQSVPSPRNSAMMVFHNSLKEVIVYGGSSHSRSSTIMRDSILWSWNGTRWKQLAKAPSLRTDATLVYDSKSDRLLLHGGAFDYSRYKGIQYEDTWSYNGKSWRLENDNFSGGHIFHSAGIFYEPENALMLFGGYYAAEETISADLRILHASGWGKFKVLGKTPPARNLHAFLYDPQSKSAIVLGGDPMQPETLKDMWSFKDGSWTCLTNDLPFDFANTHGAVVVSNGDVIAFNGNHHTGKNDTWLWHRELNKWEKLTTANPSPRNHASLCFDPIRKCVVMFGGEIGIESVNEVWELSMESLTWKQIK